MAIVILGIMVTSIVLSIIGLYLTRQQEKDQACRCNHPKKGRP